MIGLRIKELREKHGYSINELAEIAGVSKSYLSYLERDLQKNPSLKFLSKIASALVIDVEELLAPPSTEAAQLVTDVLDQEWIFLLHTAIEEGMSKDDFRRFKEFLRFQRWTKDKE